MSNSHDPPTHKQTISCSVAKGCVERVENTASCLKFGVGWNRWTPAQANAYLFGFVVCGHNRRALPVDVDALAHTAQVTGWLSQFGQMFGPKQFAHTSTAHFANEVRVCGFCVAVNFTSKAERMQMPPPGDCM